MNKQATASQSSQTSQAQDPVAVIGFGTAGFNACVALRNARYEGTICVFSENGIPPYSPILTSYYAGGEKTYDDCFPWSDADIAGLGIELLHDSPAIELDIAGHTVRTAHGDYPYSKCIIASGATPTSYGFPADCGYEPLMLRTMTDAKRLRAAITDPGCKHVLVSGASMVALKTLEACLKCGLQVTLVGMNPHVLDFNALPEAAIRFEKGLASKDVELRLGQTIKAVRLVEDAAHPLGRRLDVTFSTGDMASFDEIAVAHGMKCNLDFLAEDALEIDRALIVDEFMRTSNPDVYAAGDVAQAMELISGEKCVVGIWKNAAVQGAVAGKAIAAELAGSAPAPRDAFKGSIPTNTIAVDGTLFISAGTMEVTDRRHVEVREDDYMTVVYVYQEEADGSQRLVGFNLVCDSDEPGSLAYDTGAMLTLRIEKGCARS